MNLRSWRENPDEEFSHYDLEPQESAADWQAGQDRYERELDVLGGEPA